MKTAIKLTFGTMLVAAIAAPAQADFGSRLAVNGKLTYTEASNNGLSIADQTSPTANGVTVNRRAEFVDTDHELEWGLGFTYRMGDNSDSRFFFSWEKYDWSRDAATAPAAGLALPAALNNVSSATGSVDHDFDEFRFGFTHDLHFGDKLDVTLNAFIDYTQLERDFAFQVNDATAANVHTYRSHDEMSGWGPGFGALGRATPFDACPQLGVFGGVNTTLLWVDNEYNGSYRDNQAPAATFARDLNPEDSSSVVAKFDAQFGIDYRRLFHTSWAPLMFQAALGLQYQNLVNAFKNGNTFLALPIENLAGNALFSSAVTPGNNHDFGRWGPFLRISIGGANS